MGQRHFGVAELRLYCFAPKRALYINCIITRKPIRINTLNSTRHLDQAIDKVRIHADFRVLQIVVGAGQHSLRLQDRFPDNLREPDLH